jgi:hypothetical protein
MGIQKLAKKNPTKIKLYAANRASNYFTCQKTLCIVRMKSNLIRLVVSISCTISIYFSRKWPSRMKPSSLTSSFVLLAHLSKPLPGIMSLPSPPYLDL